MLLTDIIEHRYENLSGDETEAIRQNLAARMNLLTLARQKPSAVFRRQAHPLSEPIRRKAVHKETVAVRSMKMPRGQMTT